MDIKLARELYKQAQTLVSISFDEFLEILEKFIENQDDMVKATLVCKEMINDMYKCIALGGFYLGFKLSECIASRDCTIKVVESK